MQDGDLTSKDMADASARADLLESEWPPCRANCPVHADVRAYIELASMGRWRDAVDVIRDALPFASVCGRICHHPCEANCRRQDVDSSVAIREIKRFVSELQGAEGATVSKAASQDKARVAVIGSGPAGMSAALDLARMGYRPTVFEKHAIAGGIPATAVPRYRLPLAVVQQDIDWICAHGVELRTGVEIGLGKTIGDLKSDGFEAVLVATGLAKSRPLDIAGIEGPGLHMVLEFLTGVATGRPVSVGDDVIVIGGGNVAMDAARTAVRLGAARVRACCLENADEMPAWQWEQTEAIDEGVSFVHRRGPVEIVRSGQAITGLKVRKVLSVFDDAGSFNPAYDDTHVEELQCDTVIMAIGQSPDYGFLEGSALDTDDRGGMVFSPATQQTSRPDVFACGDIVTSAGSVVEACAHGQRAAKAIDAYLSGHAGGIVIDDSVPPAIGKIDSETAEKVLKVVRQDVLTEPAEQRRGNFDPVDHNFDVAAALAESRRCMSCGSGAEVLVDKCAACLTCLRVCPFDIPVVTDVARIDSALCQACGMCIADCPANAIIARGRDVNALSQQAADAIGAMKAEKRIVAFVCGHHSSAEAWNNALEDSLPGVAEIYLPSMSRLSANGILDAITAGAHGVIVVACERGADRYPNAAERVAKRAAQVRELLAEINMSADRVQVVGAASQGRAAVRQAMTQAAEAIRAC